MKKNKLNFFLDYPLSETKYRQDFLGVTNPRLPEGGFEGLVHGILQDDGDYFGGLE